MHKFSLGSAILYGLGLASLSINLGSCANITSLDRWEIYEQLQLHQKYIDNDASRASAYKYADLYWPDGAFINIDPLGNQTFAGPEELKNLYDYAHSVYPIYQFFHSVEGASEITGEDDTAYAEWRWEVNWKANNTGRISTGTYTDIFERRNGTWKTLNRTSIADPNWPTYLFGAWGAAANLTFKPS